MPDPAVPPPPSPSPSPSATRPADLSRRIVEDPAFPGKAPSKTLLDIAFESLRKNLGSPNPLVRQRAVELVFRYVSAPPTEPEAPQQTSSLSVLAARMDAAEAAAIALQITQRIASAPSPSPSPPHEPAGSKDQA